MENLAYACLRCNAWKGSDVGSFDQASGGFVPLFNPRQQDWAGHFMLQGFVIEPLSAEGRVTARALQLGRPLTSKAKYDKYHMKV